MKKEMVKAFTLSMSTENTSKLQIIFLFLIFWQSGGLVFYVNPFMPNVFSHPYQLDKSISNLRVVGWYFDSNFKRHFCKQTVGNLIRCRVLGRLIWFCTVCRCPTKRSLGLYGLIKIHIIKI